MFPMTALPTLSATMTFDEACTAVVTYLREAVPMGYWSVSRYDGTDQLYLAVDDRAYGKTVGDHHAWADSLCRYSVTGEAPQIAPDAMAVPLYAEAGVAQDMKIGAYIGFPVRRADGELFGTICGLDPEVQPPGLDAHAPLLNLLSALLGTILEADILRTDQARRLEQAEARAETDQLTGAINRHGWERYMALEEERYRRFGDPGSVIMLDLDGLKEVNDLHGHAEGDRYIKLAASVLMKTVRGDDLVARLGGDEFGVLATRTDAAQTALLAERLRTSLQAAGVATSIGHAPYTFVAGFPGAWEAADAALYEDKRVRRRTRQPAVGAVAGG
jgi:diguanylate cyclase